ncbi:MAG TPA: hypothetical protein VN622_12565 [Clostridia bacterium]|nr:hypothetical protein [Clostridia bacterium]
MPLGLLLMSRGVIQHEQLKTALELQQQHGGRIGEWLCKVANLTQEQVATAVGLQWGCPVFPAASADAECARSVPFHLLETYGMVPVHWVSSARELYVGFNVKVDYTALYAIEQMLDCHTEPCVLADSELNGALQRAREACNQHEIVMDGLDSAEEMTRIVISYAHQVGAASLRFVECGTYIWLRLANTKHSTDLLFRRECSSSNRDRRG